MCYRDGEDGPDRRDQLAQRGHDLGQGLANFLCKGAGSSYLVHRLWFVGLSAAYCDLGQARDNWNRGDRARYGCCWEDRTDQTWEIVGMIPRFGELDGWWCQQPRQELQEEEWVLGARVHF